MWTFIRGFVARLEQHHRVPRPVPQLVLRQITGDRIDPGRELLRRVEPVEVPVDSNERLLNEILGTIPVADRPIDEVQKPQVVPIRELVKRSSVAAEILGNESGIVQRLEIDTRISSAGLPGGLFQPDSGHFRSLFTGPRVARQLPMRDRRIPTASIVSE